MFPSSPPPTCLACWRIFKANPSCPVILPIWMMFNSTVSQEYYTPRGIPEEPFMCFQEVQPSFWPFHPGAESSTSLCKSHAYILVLRTPLRGSSLLKLVRSLSVTGSSGQLLWLGLGRHLIHPHLSMSVVIPNLYHVLPGPLIPLECWPNKAPSPRMEL